MENLGLNNLFGGIYKGKRVLITGHTGFKGSWLMYWLHKMEANVFGLALDPPTQPNHFSLLNFQSVSYIQDITDKTSVQKIINDINPEIIFHLAAQPLVRLSYLEPYQTYLTNVIGTLNVLEASRNVSNIKAIIVVTSDKCYENNEWLWGYRENEAMGGKDPYSSSKGCVELLTTAYRESYFNLSKYGDEHNVLIATVRAGNVIGGGDWALDRIITDIVLSAQQDLEVVLRYPNSTRPWQHVLEPLSGYLTLGWRLLNRETKFATAWNFGPNHENNISVLGLVQEAQKHWGKIKFIVHTKEYLHEAGFLMLDSSKANKLLNWEPVWNFSKTVDKTITWYKEYYQLQKVITLNDLEEYIIEAKNKSLIWSSQ